MRFIRVQGFSIKPGKETEFQNWLVANEERLKKSYPAGIEYGGIYVAIFSSEKGVGDFYSLDILDSYAAMDRSAALSKDPTSEWAKVNAELIQFVDFDRSAGRSDMLLKAITDATIVDTPPD
jgi:hypothetical protein